MWKTLVAGTTMLMMAGSTLAFAQQPTPADRAHHTQLTADDLAAFADARFAALKTALKLTPSQEKNWPAVEQALRDISKARTARRQARESVGQQTDPIERLHDRADALTARAEALRRLADAEKPLYQSLDEAQKRRFALAFRFAVTWLSGHIATGTRAERFLAPPCHATGPGAVGHFLFASFFQEAFLPRPSLTFLRGALPPALDQNIAP